MEAERVADAGAGGAPSHATSRDASAYIETAPPQSQISHGRSRGPSMGAPEQQHGHAYRRPADVDSEAFARLEQQVAYNYTMIQGHHGEIGQLNEIVAQMQREMAAVVNVLEEVRGDLRARPSAPQPAESGRYDPGDIEVLSAHIAAVTTKANEVDNLKYQVELMRRRISRAEDAGVIRASARPGTSSSHPEAAAYEAQHAQAPPAQSLPPMRPGAGFAAEQNKQHGFAAAPLPESQVGHAYHPTHAQARHSIPNDQQISQPHPPGFRPAEALPPPSALTGWRPAEAYPASAVPPPPAPAQQLRSNPLEPEAQTSGWAAVNLNQAAKRTFDDQSPHDTSQPGSPKRPKLAPLKPRSSYGEEQAPTHQSPFTQVSHPDPSHLPRQRLSSGDAQAPAHGHFIPAPASAVSTNNYRFITSTGQPDGQEPWRPDTDRGTTSQVPQGSEGGRGRGRGGGRGSRGGRGRRGGRGAAQSAAQASEVPSQEIAQAPPEWRDSNWPGRQASPNGHFAGYHPFSPADVQRGVPVELAVHTGSVPPPPPPHPQLQVAVAPSGQEAEFPATPITGSADPFQGDSGKKSRTKPIRNAEGILIRKDGRPDMRSVSSANNLRKVHAKKEAERAEMEGRTPTSARSLAPANSSSLSDDEGEDHGHVHDDHDGELEDHMHDEDHDEHEESASRTGTPATQAESERHGASEQHHAHMNRILDTAHSGERSKSTAEAWFPRRDDAAPELKREHQESGFAGRWRGAEDVAIKETDPSEPSQQASEQPSKDQTPNQVSEAATSELTEMSAEARGAAPEQGTRAGGVEAGQDAGGAVQPAEGAA